MHARVRISRYICAKSGEKRNERYAKRKKKRDRFFFFFDVVRLHELTPRTIANVRPTFPFEHFLSIIDVQGIAQFPHRTTWVFGEIVRIDNDDGEGGGYAIIAVVSPLSSSQTIVIDEFASVATRHGRTNDFRVYVHEATYSHLVGMHVIPVNVARLAHPAR